MGNPKIDPVVVVEAAKPVARDSSPKELTKSSTLPTNPSRRGIGRFLSRRRSLKPSHVKVPPPALPPTEKQVFQAVHVKKDSKEKVEKEANQEESITTADESDEEMMLEDVAPSEVTTPSATPLKVEIDTRNIPINAMAPKEGDGEASPQGLVVPALPSVQDLLLQLAFLKDSTPVNEVTEPKSLEAFDGNQIESDLENTDTELKENKNELNEEITDNILAQVPVFFEQASQSFVSNMEICGSLKCNDNAVNRQPERLEQPQEEPKVISFEEYDDNHGVPVLLQSSNKDLDVFSLGDDVASGDINEKDSTRGLEVVLTLPEC